MPKQKSRLDEELSKIEADIKSLKSAVRTGANTPKPSESTIRAAQMKIPKLDRDRIPNAKELHRKIQMKLQGEPAHLFSLLASTVILAYLLGSFESWLLFTAIGLITWKTIHHLHVTKAHKLDQFISGGLMIIPLYLVYLLTNDLYGITVIGLYAISFVTSGLLYIFHTKRGRTEELHNSFPKTFLTMIFAHFVAGAFGLSMAFMLMNLNITDHFVSIQYIIWTIILPSTLVYFFLTKFLYLRFFDTQHIKKDIIKGIAHGLSYALILTVCLSIAYLLTAIQLTATARAENIDILSDASIQFPNIRADISEITYEYQTTELADTKTAKDIVSDADKLKEQLNRVRTETSRLSFSFTQYMTDEYFDQLSKDQLNVNNLQIQAANINSIRDDMLREYRKTRYMLQEGQFDDGTDNIISHNRKLAAVVGSRFTEYEPIPEISYIENKLENKESYPTLLGDGMLEGFLLIYSPNTRILRTGRSNFAKSVHNTFSHTKIYRDFMLLEFQTLSKHTQEVTMPSTINTLFEGMTQDETTLSKTLRYRIIKTNLDATLALAR